jgi:hypothetical protein
MPLVEASRRNVEFGTGTEFDLLTAQNNYYTAVRAYSQSRYDALRPAPCGVCRSHYSKSAGRSGCAAC